MSDSIAIRNKNRVRVALALQEQEEKERSQRPEILNDERMQNNFPFLGGENPDKNTFASLGNGYDMGIPQGAKEQAHNLDQLMRALGAGTVKQGRGLANLPHTIASMASPEFADKYMGTPADRNFDWEKQFGVEDTLANKLASGFAEYGPTTMTNAPAGVAKGIGLAAPAFVPKLGAALGRVGEGGFQGMLASLLEGKPEKAKVNAPLGAGLQAGAELFGGGFRVGKNAFNKLRESYGAPELMESLKKLFAEGLPESKIPAAQLAIQKTKETSKDASDIWESLKADTKDIHLNEGMNLSGFKKDASNLLSHLEEQSSKSTGLEHKNTEAIKILENELQEKLPKLKTVGDLIDFRQGLNYHYGRLNPQTGAKADKNAVDTMIAAFNKDAEKILEENGFSAIAKKWEKANQETKNLHKEYLEIENPELGISSSKLANLKGNPNPKSPELLIEDYVPIPGEESIGKIEQLENILENPEMARGAILHRMFNVTDKKHIDAKEALTVYKNMAPKIRDRLLNPEQKEAFRLMEKVLKNNPKALTNSEEKARWLRVLDRTVFHPIEQSLKEFSVKPDFQKSLMQKYKHGEYENPNPTMGGDYLSKALRSALEGYKNE